MKTTRGLKIAVLDTETDPFKRDRIPEPFTAGFYDGQIYLSEWGPGCVDRLLKAIADLDDDYLIYCHNGGKFDFWSMLDWINEKSGMSIINGRLVEFTMTGTRNLFRDSLAIIPVSLAAYQKEKIDYRIFEKDKRDLPKNRPIIAAYLKSDCVNLYELVTKFAARFANEKDNIPISIGQASIRELRELHDFQIMTEASDAEIRPWYLGGRVQCFASGILPGPWKVYDVNGMYSKVMAEYDHPLSDLWENLDRPPRSKKSVWFAQFEGTNRQAIPVDTPDGITFEQQDGVFRAVSHELVPAIAAGLVRVDKWLSILKPTETGNFTKFVNKWQGAKVRAEQSGDKAGRLFAKLIMNSAYGKTGQNPGDFRDYKLCRNIFQDEKLRELGYAPEARLSDEPFLEMWSRKSATHSHGFYNVGIAASVTSAARAVLLDGLQKAVRPIYCDTDSIICKSFKGEIDATKLGAWKHEATAQFAAIAGKKLYCLYNQEGRKIVPVKWASKGGDLDPLDIIRIAKGATVAFCSEVPTYSLSQGIQFISRNFRKTVDKPKRFK